MELPKRTARLAGLLYLLSSLTAPFALLYVPGRLFVEGDPAATAERLRSLESLARAGIAAELLGQVLFIFVALTLYRLFKPTSATPALTMLVLILISFPIVFLNVLNELAALNLAGGGTGARVSSLLDSHQRDALAYLAMHLHGQGYMVAQIFWGLWLFPFGTCVLRSGFIPRVLGYLLMIAGGGYVASSLAALALPQYQHAVDRVTTITNFGELPIIFWLLIWGAKEQRGRARPGQPAAESSVERLAHLLIRATPAPLSRGAPGIQEYTIDPVTFPPRSQIQQNQD
jgi:hypothetical protein